MFSRSACVPLSLCVIVVDSMLIVVDSMFFFSDENNKSRMWYTLTRVRLNLHYTQDREFTGGIISQTAMLHLFLQFYVILLLIIKVFFCFIYYNDYMYIKNIG